MGVQADLIEECPCVVRPVVHAAERHPPQVLTHGVGGDELIARQVLVESFRACERSALADLAAVTGDRSLCSLSRQGAPVPTVKYHEGAAAALAEVRRAVETLADDSGVGHSARAVLLNVRARWREQSHTMGSRGPDWAGYLTGGLDALEQMIDDMEGSMSSTPRTDPANRPAVVPTDPTVATVATVATDPTDPTEPTGSTALSGRRRYARVLAAWPLRRRMTIVVLAPMLLALMVAVSGGWALATSPGWTAVVVLIALSCATTLATYLPHPGTGLRVDVGCTPCAALAAVSVLGALIVLSSAPHEVSTAFLALGISAFGLVQRLNNPSTCPA